MRALRIDHVTEYQFGTEVTLLPHRLLLRPRESHSLRISASSLNVTPAATVRWMRDAHDNSLAQLSFSAPARTLHIKSQVSIEHYDQAPLDFFVDPSAVAYPFDYSWSEQQDLAPMRALLWPNDRGAVQEWLRQASLPQHGQETFSLLDQLNRRIANSFRYQVRDEQGVQTAQQTLALGSGSCRDFAALFVEASRCLGLAARFVSGYRRTAPELGDGSTHAWAEVYLPGPGWKAFDPTEGVLTGNEHIAVAVARHPECVPPIAGSFVGPGGVCPTMHVSVRVEDVL